MKRGKVFLSFSTMPLIGEILLVVCVMTKMASYLNNTCWSHTVLLRCLGTAPRRSRRRSRRLPLYISPTVPHCSYLGVPSCCNRNKNDDRNKNKNNRDFIHASVC